MSQVQTWQGTPALNGVGGTIATTGAPGTNLTSGHHIVVYVFTVNDDSAGTTQTITVTDSAGNTYTECTGKTIDDVGKVGRAGIWIAPITAGVGTKPTITLSLVASGSFSEVTFTAEERTEAFTGVADVSSALAAGAFAQSQDTGTSAAATASGEYVVSLIIGYRFSTPTFTVTSSSPTLTFDTNLSIATYMAVASGVSTNGATCECLWGLSTNEVCSTLVVAFRLPSTNATATPGVISCHVSTPTSGPVPPSGASGLAQIQTTIGPWSITPSGFAFGQSYAVANGFTAANVTTGNRIIVYVIAYAKNDPSTNVTVLDNVGNTYTKMAGGIYNLNSVNNDWAYIAQFSAPITVGGGTKPVITVNSLGTLNVLRGVGWSAEEVSGLSRASGTGCVDTFFAGNINTRTTGDMIAGPTGVVTANLNEYICSMVADIGDNTTTWLVNSGPTFPAMVLDNNLSPQGSNTAGQISLNIAVAHGITSSGASTCECVWTPSSSESDSADIVVYKLQPAMAITISCVTVIPAATATVGAHPAPTVISCVVTVPAPNITATIATPVVIQCVTTIPAPSITIGKIVLPFPISAITTQLAPTIVPTLPTAVAIVCLTTVPAPTIPMAAHTTPGVISCIGTIPAPTIKLRPWANIQSLTVAATNTGVNPNTRTGTWTSNITIGNRIILFIHTTGGRNAISDIATPTDTAGNIYTQLVTGNITDTIFLYNTQIWSAPITAGSGTKPTISVTTSGGSTDNILGWSAAEYAGLSSAAGSACLDTSTTAQAFGMSASTQATAPAGADGELMVGFVSDAGSGGIWTMGASTPALIKNASLSNDAGANTSWMVAEGTSFSGVAAQYTANSSVSTFGSLTIAIIKLTVGNIPATATPTTVACLTSVPIQRGLGSASPAPIVISSIATTLPPIITAISPVGWVNVQTVKAIPIGSGSAGNETRTITWPSNNTAGNRIILMVTALGGANATAVINTPVDGINTWTRLLTKSSTVSGLLFTLEFWTAQITATTITPPTISVTVSGGSTDNACGLTAAEYSGLDVSPGAGCLDVSATNNAISSSLDLSTGVTGTVAAAGELIIAAVADEGDTATWTVASSAPVLTKNTAMSHDGGGTGDSDVFSYAIAEGTTTKVTGPPFATSIALNGHYMLDQYGQPQLLVGASDQTFTNLSASDIQFAMQTRAAQGFNWQQALIISSQASDLATGTPDWATVDNIVPFFKSDGTTLGTGPGDYDVTKPNPPYWTRVDVLFQVAQTCGVTLLVSLLGDPVWVAGSNAFYVAQGTTKLATFATWFANRYKGFNYHHLWGYDHFTTIAGGWAAYDPYITVMMNAVKAVNARCFHTIENNDGIRETGAEGTSLASDDPSWTIGSGVNQMSLNWMYENRDNGPAAVRAYNLSPPAPVFFGEGLYDSAPPGKNTWSNLLNRKYLWFPMVNGCCGSFYGHDTVWHYGSGWQTAILSPTPIAHIGVWKAFMQAIKWWTLVPDSGHTFVTIGNTYSLASSIGTNAAVAADGSLGLIYLTANGSVTIDMTKMRSTTTARWFDPTNGAYTAIGNFANTGTHTFTSSTNNVGGDPDWVLVLSAPGLANVTISPSNVANIQAVVDLNPAGTTYILPAGKFRLNSIIPKTNDIFIGAGHSSNVTAADGTIYPGVGGNATFLSGAKVLTPWTHNLSPNYWFITGQSQGPLPAQSPSICLAQFPGCYHSEDLFFDNVIKQRVETLGAVAPGKWFFDYTADTIYVGDDPTSHTVETSVIPTAFSGSAGNVTIRNMTIEKYGNILQTGAIDARSGNNWRIEDITAQYNHGVGLQNGPNGIIQRCAAIFNGQMGIAGTGANMINQDSEIAFNDTVGVDPGWEAGGSKWTNSTDLIIARIYAHDQIHGGGLWTDISNLRVTYDSNLVMNNPDGGISHEIGYDALFKRNIVINCGNAATGYWPNGSGILVSSSGGTPGNLIEAYDNYISGCKNGIVGMEQNRPGDPTPYGPLLTRNLFIHDNVEALTPIAATGLATDTADVALFDAAINRFDRNTLIVPDPVNTPATAWNNSYQTFPAWQGFGLDTNGTAETAPVIAFGIPRIGSTSGTQTSGWRWGNIYPCPVSTTLTSFLIYCSGIGAASSQIFIPMIYNVGGNGGLPTSLLATGSTVTIHVGDTARWYTSTISAPVLANHWYLIGTVGGGNGFQAQMYYFDQTSQSYFSPNAGGNTPDANWGPLLGGGISGQRWSFYVR